MFKSVEDAIKGGIFGLACGDVPDFGLPIGISFADATHGWLVGSQKGQGIILHTIDGGTLRRYPDSSRTVPGQFSVNRGQTLPAWDYTRLWNLRISETILSRCHELGEKLRTLFPLRKYWGARYNHIDKHWHS